MVRKIEVEQTRRSKMAHSSVNAGAKKGGAGGKYTWGNASDVGYEVFDFELNSFGVKELMAPEFIPNVELPIFSQAEVNLDDQDAFPCLPTSAVKLQEVVKGTTPAPETDAFPSLPTSGANLQEVAKAGTPAPDTNTSLTPDTTSPVDLSDEWVVVAPPGLDSLRFGALDLVNSEHPRNTFAKKPRAKKMQEEGNVQERAFAIDWSQSGIPQEVKRQIIKASMNASHQGIYVKEQESTLPLDMLRAQNSMKTRRENSAARFRQNTVPRSRSVPRFMKQADSRR